MTIKKSMNGCFILALFIAFIIFFTGGLRAQVPPIDSLRNSIIAKEDSLHQLNKTQKRLSQSFDALNAKIFAQKKELKASSNMFTWLKLKENLKKSNRLAVKLDRLQRREQRIKHALVNAYRQIIATIDSVVRQKMQTINNHENSRAKIELLNQINRLENEKKIWQTKLTAFSPNQAQEPLLKIEPDDTIERLRLKIQILQDRIRQIENELIKLHKRKDELKSDLQIYEEMLGFIDNLQQHIDPDQEYFDQERNDQLKENVRDIKLKISGIDERTNQLKQQKTNLENVVNQFKDHLKIMLNQ